MPLHDGLEHPDLRASVEAKLGELIDRFGDKNEAKSRESIESALRIISNEVLLDLALDRLLDSSESTWKDLRMLPKIVEELQG